MHKQIIDLDGWDRGQLFSFYIHEMPIVISLTVDVDAAPLVSFAKRHGLRFYPAMIWAVSKVVNAHDEFKYGWDPQGRLIRWDCVFPSYADFHKEDQRFTKLVTPYTEDLFAFHARFLADKERFAQDRGILPGQPPNFFDVSCLPWVRYRHFDVHVFDQGRFLAPVITWGRFEPEGSKLVLPLTMNIHHAVADGFHLSRFFNEVQQLIYTMA